MYRELRTLSGYVYDIGEGNIYIRVFDRELKRKIKSIGASRPWIFRLIGLDFYMWKITYQNDKELASLLSKLRDFKIPFAVGKGFGPAEYFEVLRDKKELIRGKYKRLNWTGEGKNEVNIEEV